MSDTLKLALTITAVDMFSGVLRHLRGRIQGAGAEAQRVRKDFDQMERSINKGVKAMAATAYLAAKMRPGVDAAADLQESLLNVKRLIWQSGEGAGDLANKLAKVRQTAVQVSADLPYSAKDLADIEGKLLQGGMSIGAVTGAHGAAFVTAALAATNKDVSVDEASSSIAKIAHAFQLRKGEFSPAANDIAKITNTAPTDLHELLYNLRQAGPQAHALHIPLKNTAIALGAISSLGLEGGTDLRQFLYGLSGATPEAQKAMKYLHVNFFNKKGHFVGIEESIQRLRKALGKVHNEQIRTILLNKMFQTEGAQAANLLLNTGNYSYEDIKKKAAAAAGLARQEKIWAEGLNASLSKLGGSTQSTLANLFNPMMVPLREAVNETNKLVSNIGEIAGKHKTVADTFSIVAGGAVAGGAAYALFRLLKAGHHGMRVLKGLRGMRGLAGNLAAGKALEAAAGVTPVYVVNMPAGGLGSETLSSSTISEERSAAKVASRFSALRKIAPLADGALDLGLAGAGGYAIGTAINKGLLQDKNGNDNSVGRAIGEGIAHVMAWFGDHSAQQAIQTDMHKHQPSEVHVRVELESKDGSKARVKSISSRNAKAQLDTAPALAGGL